jgi:uncharacterized protein with HEPN domain
MKKQDEVYLKEILEQIVSAQKYIKGKKSKFIHEK